MDWRRPFGVVGWLLVAVVLVGALATLTIATLQGSDRFAAMATTLFLLVVIAGIAVVGSKSIGWLANPYW